MRRRRADVAVPSGGTKLRHFSPKRGLTVLDPKFIGSGQLSWRERQDTGVPVTFYYIAGTEPETLITGVSQAEYEATLPPEAKIFDLASGEPWVGEAWRANGTGLYKAIKERGFFGFLNTSSALPNAVAVFYPLPVHEVARQKVARTVRPTATPGGVYYHGTSAENVLEILRVGLRADTGAKFSPAVENDPQLHKQLAVYLTTWFDLAVRYAEGLQGDNEDIAVIEVKLDPASVQPDLMDDPRGLRWPPKSFFGKPGNPMLRGQVQPMQFLYEGDIPVSAIQAVYLSGGDQLTNVPSLAGEIPETYEEMRSVYFQLKRFLNGDSSWQDVIDEVDRVHHNIENVDMSDFEDKLMILTDFYDVDEVGHPEFETMEDENVFFDQVEAVKTWLHKLLFEDEGVGFVVTDRSHTLQRLTPEQARELLS